MDEYSLKIYFIRKFIEVFFFTFTYTRILIISVLY